MEPRGLHRVRPDSPWATKDVRPVDGRSPPGAREPLQVSPGCCGPLKALLLPTLAPIQQTQVPTQITVNRCVSPLAAPAAPLTPAPHSTPASSGRSSRSAARFRRHYTILPAQLWAKKALGPGTNLPLPLPHFAYPPLVPRRGLPLPRLRQKSELPGPDRAHGAGPHSSGLTQPPTPARAPVHTPGEERRRRMGGDGAQEPPEAATVSLRCVGDAWEQALSSATLPQAALFKEPPTPWGATCPSHWAWPPGPASRSEGPDHMWRGLWPLCLRIPHSWAAARTASRGLGRSLRRLPRPGEASSSHRFLAGGAPLTQDAAQRCLCTAQGPPTPSRSAAIPRASPPPRQALGAGPGPQSQTRTLAPQGTRPAVRLRRSSTHGVPIRAQERLGWPA
ncbi:hypothetical protein NDU88_000813 [Pleurodeles waltl]|uniref:Uncharacterized protein n=1 Tax=Pleurodeles waltl TaxID=8319 RepID=A0AAV7L7N6_PLEWA|nr:hypothetical protein NDU88_000813 [Pleurodeles waltl]